MYLLYRHVQYWSALICGKNGNVSKLKTFMIKGTYKLSFKWTSDSDFPSRSSPFTKGDWKGLILPQLPRKCPENAKSTTEDRRSENGRRYRRKSHFYRPTRPIGIITRESGGPLPLRTHITMEWVDDCKPQFIIVNSPMFFVLHTLIFCYRQLNLFAFFIK